MRKGISVRFLGQNSEPVARALAERLRECRRRAECIDEPLARRIGSPESCTTACDVLVRNGVIVLLTAQDVQPTQPPLDIYVDAWHTAEDAVDHVLNSLARLSVIDRMPIAFSAVPEPAAWPRAANWGYAE
ncbi:MAG: hypothetical protein AMXMBFR4_25410 [Candidatus Hydrogenedentota bacterium]